MGVREIHAKEVNDEETVVGRRYKSGFVKNKIIIKNEVFRKKPDKTLPQLVYMTIYLAGLPTEYTMVQVEIFLLCTAPLGTRSWISPPPGWWGAWSYLTPWGSLIKEQIPLALRVTMLTSWD